MNDPANDFLRTQPDRVIPGFTYFVQDYKHERLLSFVPIHGGDTISFKLASGEFIRDAKVKRVIHYPSMGCESGQLLEAMIELDE